MIIDIFIDLFVVWLIFYKFDNMLKFNLKF